MKKTIITLSILLGSTPFLSAQYRGVSILGGANKDTRKNPYEKNTSPNKEEQNGNFGAEAGMRFDFDIAEMTQFSPELIVVTKNSKQTIKNANSLVSNILERNINLNYVGLNLPIKYNTVENSRNDANGFFASGKIFIDYLLGANFRDNNSSESVSFTFDNLKDNMDFGLTSEVGLVVNNKVFIAGYSYGLNRINFANAKLLSNVQFELPQQARINSGFYVQVGYTIPN